MAQQVESSLESPEALLRMLDAQIAAQRAKRQDASPHRGAILAAAIIFVVGGGMIAVAFVFMEATSHMHRGGSKPAGAPVTATQH